MSPDPNTPVPDRIASGIERARQHIAGGGSVWTGPERVALAGAARRAAAGEDSFNDSPTDAVPALALETAKKIAANAHTVTVTDVNRFDKAAAYVEIVGVVARTSAIDTVARGAGLSPVAFPAPSSDAPSGIVEPTAKRRSAFVPTVGAAGPPTALSLVPTENEAQADLHGALYLSYLEMGDIAIRKGLPRWQLELVAARTSLINHCFYWLFAHGGMLRASAQATGVKIDLRSVGDRERHPRREDAAALLRLTDALVGRTADLDDARKKVGDVLGLDAVAPSAAAAGNFEMMNRIVDAVGVPVPASMWAIGGELGLATDR